MDLFQHLNSPPSQKVLGTRISLEPLADISQQSSKNLKVTEEKVLRSEKVRVPIQETFGEAIA
jgi:hypothetical protein